MSAERPSLKYRLISFADAMSSKPLAEVGHERARKATRKSASMTMLFGRRPPLASVRDEVVAGVKVRRYLPSEARAGTLVYFHGGGWVLGDLDTHDVVSAQFSAATQREVVAVDYRLAPEHRYPAALEDCVAVSRELAKSSKVVVAGDSAGGNLAACVSQNMSVSAQVLIYPVTDCASEWPSYESFANGLILTRESMRYFHREYVPNVAQRAEVGVSPLRAASLSGLAPAYVLLAQCDVLRDEGRAYAKRLGEHGVEHVLDEVPGTVHGFMSLQGLSEARESVQRVAKWLEAKW
ncbi:MAG: alpha/beta hydrolase [Archangium sp.]|nr:alpha/beta hydrolase [Archangium sp.]